MNRFEDIFRPFLQGNVARELLRAPIQHIDAQRERRQITVELCPEQRIPQKEIHRVEQQIMETANLALFEIMTRYRPELFCCESMEDILHELRKRGYPANGIFEGSQQKLEGDRLTISLQHGGYNLIKESGCDQAIRRAISERYGMAVDVQFDGVLSLEESDPAYKEIIGKPSLTPEMKAALERPSNAPKPSASRGEAGGKAGDKPSKPGRLLFDCEDLPFVPDSGVLILGKPIKEKPVPLKEVTAETGLTTVWGDIVRKESVTSKDGKWEIYSIDITDYTSSNTLKIIQSSSKKEAIEELKEGDTLVVGDKGPTVTATGAVRNAARFEFLKGRATGAALMELAEPERRASHVALNGTRNGAPYSTYLPLKELRHLNLEDGDRVEFMADATGNTMMIEVQGAVRGTSRFPVRRGARLKDVQNFIAVEPGRANIKAMYIKRKSVAVRQKKAIEDALRRLEQNAYTATSASSDEAQIRSKEAEMLSSFISRAKEVQPEGVVVVGTKGNIADLALEDGDVIVIPEKTDVVLISGEVMMPQAIVWNKDKDMDDYIKGAGGFSNRADESNLIVVHPSGEVIPRAKEVLPGDQVLVLPRVESKNLQAVKDISQVLYQVAVACKVILDL